MEESKLPQPLPLPKKSCMITLMFEIQDMELPLQINSSIQDLIKDIEKKRYTFQIDER